MSTNTARTLLDRMAADADFRTRVESAPDQDAKKAILTEAGFGEVTPGEVEAAGKDFSPDLSDAELEAVVGGSKLEWGAVGGILVVAGAVAAA